MQSCHLTAQALSCLLTPHGEVTAPPCGSIVTGHLMGPGVISLWGETLSVDWTWVSLGWSPKLFTADIHPCVTKDFEWICRWADTLGVSNRIPGALPDESVLQFLLLDLTRDLKRSLKEVLTFIASPWSLRFLLKPFLFVSLRILNFSTQAQSECS